jgi:hypothetical protein
MATRPWTALLLAAVFAVHGAQCVALDPHHGSSSLAAFPAQTRTQRQEIEEMQQLLTEHRPADGCRGVSAACPPHRAPAFEE